MSLDAGKIPVLPALALTQNSKILPKKLKSIPKFGQPDSARRPLHFNITEFFHKDPNWLTYCS
jgi:hypothetical protein